MLATRSCAGYYRVRIEQNSLRTSRREYVNRHSRWSQRRFVTEMLHLERSWEKTWRSRLGPGLRTRVLQVLGPGWAQAEAHTQPSPPNSLKWSSFSPPAIAGLITAAAGQCNGACSALTIAGIRLAPCGCRTALGSKWHPLGASIVGGVPQTPSSACAERRLSASAFRSGVQQTSPSACAERHSVPTSLRSLWFGCHFFSPWSAGPW